MKKYDEVLRGVRLFKGIDEKDLSSLLSCLDARIISPEKNEFVLMAGDRVNHIGIVLSGSLHIIKEDAEGERAVIAALSKGDFYAEALCCANVEMSPVSVLTNTKSSVMLIEYGRILHTCPSSCSFHAKLIENMLFIIAEKNIMLQNRMEIISQKTVRLKMLAFLEFFVGTRGEKAKIPFNREQLADYLCVNRSALSHELSRMKHDGLIDYHKNQFVLM